MRANPFQTIGSGVCVTVAVACIACGNAAAQSAKSNRERKLSGPA